LEVFKEEHGRYPDLVVLHSNYWDVAQIVLFREDDGQEHAYGPLMKIWLANAEKVGKFLQVMPSLGHLLEICPSTSANLMRQEQQSNASAQDFWYQSHSKSMDGLPEKAAIYMLSGVRRHITGQGGGLP